MTNRAEELAMRVAVDLVSAEHPADITKSILSALHEYGALVRARDAEVCGGLFANHYPHSASKARANECAAAISREPLP